MSRAFWKSLPSLPCLAHGTVWAAQTLKALGPQNDTKRKNKPSTANRYFVFLKIALHMSRRSGLQYEQPRELKTNSSFKDIHPARLNFASVIQSYFNSLE
jgi:hypothetical protein